MIVDDKYELVEEVGKGGMCAVWKARHLKLGKVVAVKQLLEKYAQDPAAAERFRREAVATCALKHPNILETVGYGIWDDRPYFAMEFIDGQSLDAVLAEQEGKRMPEERAAAIVKQICDALAYAHQKGIVHRDLKPSNVMVLKDGTIKIVDFGLAKFLPHSGQDVQKLTQTGQVFGTVLYMSPEQLMGKELDHRSDLYSLGCVMHELVAGEPPFKGDMSLEVLSKHLAEKPPQLEGISPTYNSVTRALLKKEKEQRLQFAQDVKVALDNPNFQHVHHTPGALTGSPVPKNNSNNSAITKKVVGALCAVVLVAGTAFIGMKMFGGPSGSEAQGESDTHEVPEHQFNDQLNRLLRVRRYSEAAELLRARIQHFTATARTGTREYRIALTVLGQTNLASKNYPEAIENYTELYHYFDNSKEKDAAWQKGVAAVALAQAYMLTHDFESAIKIDKEALTLLPEDPNEMTRSMPEQASSRLDALVGLAQSYWTLHKNDDALKYAHEAMKCKEVPGNPNFRKLKEVLIEQAEGFHQDDFVREFASY